jgi:hypothetical protein
MFISVDISRVPSVNAPAQPEWTAPHLTLPRDKSRGFLLRRRLATLTGLTSAPQAFFMTSVCPTAVYWGETCVWPQHCCHPSLVLARDEYTACAQSMLRCQPQSCLPGLMPLGCNNYSGRDADAPLMRPVRRIPLHPHGGSQGLSRDFSVMVTSHLLAVTISCPVGVRVCTSPPGVYVYVHAVWRSSIRIARAPSPAMLDSHHWSTAEAVVLL